MSRNKDYWEFLTGECTCTENKACGNHYGVYGELVRYAPKNGDDLSKFFPKVSKYEDLKYASSESYVDNTEEAKECDTAKCKECGETVYWPDKDTVIDKCLNCWIHFKYGPKKDYYTRSEIDVMLSKIR